MLKARIRNRATGTIGCSTRCSMSTNATSSSTPPIRPASTQGFVQPVACAPYGWIP